MDITPTTAARVVNRLTQPQKDAILRDLISCLHQDRIRDIVDPNEPDHRPEWQSLDKAYRVYLEEIQDPASAFERSHPGWKR